VVGYKPSFDRISKAGVIPLSRSADHVGFFVPRAGDAGLVAGLLCQAWQPATGMPRPVLGIPEGPYLARASQEALAHFEATCQLLEGAGFAVKRVAIMPDFDQIYARHNRIVAAEAAQVHETWYGRHGDLYHPKTAELIERGRLIGDEALREARLGQHALRETLGVTMDARGIDIWLSPSATGPAPLGLDSTGDPVMNLPWSYAGLPTITLPSGRNEKGLPLGLQLAGRWYRDEDLLAWAPSIEAVLGY
jgi:Asp-tRNA(Asn)/Glu-tRNA(Gln) amidotransferase A subunit family amidase